MVMRSTSVISGLIGLTAILSLPNPSFAQPDTSFYPNTRPEIRVPRIAQSINIDGKIDDEAWEMAFHAANFCEYNPGDMTKPPVDTDVLLAYDDANLYVAFIAYDDPATVRTSVRDRDEAWQDDNVGIMLDTYGDGTWMYEIFSNPIGIQGDLRWANGDEDTGFDLIYQSAGIVTDSGYQVEMAIPFKNLRFPNKEIQTWRATFWRNHPRSVRGQYSWAAIDKNIGCFPCQFGTLTGVEGIRPGRDFSLLPSVTGYNTAEIRDWDDPNSGLKYDRIDGRLSLGLKYSLSSSSSIEAAWKPDFSQIESDAAQIDVNSTFALFYSERRPFFQEGSDLFSTWMRAVYTRSINDPIFAAKVVGRMEHTNFAVLASRDEHSPMVLPFEERGAVIATSKSNSTVVRIRQSYGENSFIGALVTTRLFDGGGSGSLGGIDGRQRLTEQFAFYYQYLVSRTEEQNDSSLTEDIDQAYFDRGRHTVALDNESYWGRGFYLGLERDAKFWNFSVDYLSKDPEFRTANGFVTGNDRKELSTWQGLNFYPNNKFVRRVNPSITLGRVWNYDNVRKDEWLRPGIWALFAYQTEVEFGYIWSRELFREIYFPGIRRYELSVYSNFSDPVNAGFEITAGRSIARNLDTPVLGRNRDIELWATLKPWSRFVIRPSWEYSRMDYPAGANIYEGYIARTRFNYQFSRELMARLILQYDDFDRNLSLEPLLSYKHNPFTVFYIGSTSGFDKFDSHDGLTQTSQQFFLKFQYLMGL